MDAEQRTRLLDLWQRRPTLDRTEVGELFEIVNQLLDRACRRYGLKSLLMQLPFEAQDYIADFFEYKVFRSPGTDRLDHEGAVLKYFRNYLFDRLRKEKIPTAGGTGGEPDGESAMLQEAVPAAEAFGGSGCHAIDPETTLINSLPAPDRVAESALTFLKNCPAWARLFLYRHDCADKEDKIGRDALAREFAIPSYAHKAYKLGVVIPGNRRREGSVEFDYYATTMLGRWMEEDLGIEIHPDNLPLIRGCLKILCQTALTHINGQGDML